jgi:hypothetical protein
MAAEKSAANARKLATAQSDPLASPWRNDLSFLLTEN